jgi:hypothetical protein
MSKAMLTLEQLRGMNEYVRLTDKQKALVDAFVMHGHDRVKAYQVTHPTCSKESAEKGAYKVFSRAAVRTVLDIYFSVDPADVYEQLLLRAMQNPKITPSQIRALEMYAEKHGFNSGSPKPAAPVAAPTVPAPAPQAPAVVRPARDPRIPEGAVALRDSAGVIRGYKTAEGQKVRFADVEVTK